MTSIPHAPSSFSMLLVEDETVTLELLANILAKKYPGATIHTASNGKAGLDLFKSHSHDIVITDINMPEMNGVQMAEKIRAINSDTKLIVITGDTGKFVLQDSTNDLKLGPFIMKPVVFRELFAIIELCLADISSRSDIIT